MEFEFTTTGRIVFGWGSAKRLALREYGAQPMLVTGRRTPLLAVDGLRFVVTGEPSVDLVREGVAVFRNANCDMVVGVGGGSVIDAAKAIAAMVTNSGEPLDYLEVIGRGHALECAPAPFIAIPTTAGTGSEVTRNAVLGSREHGVKASLRSPMMLPRLAVVDPELTTRLPPALTASTGLDALTQLIEPYVSLRANALTDLYCLEGIRCVSRSLRRAFTNGFDAEARTDMSFASLLGGMALANAGLGVIHGFAAPIGGMFDAPHGAVCAALLTHGMAANIRALRLRLPDSEPLRRYATVAAIVSGKQDAQPEDGVAWVMQLCAALAIPGLRAYGVSEKKVAEVVDKAMKASSMKANPIVLTREELIIAVAEAL
jgi:alcohol dehydrogenase class IV